MVLVIAIYKILLDRARFKETDLLSVSESVGDSRNSAIGVDFQEPGLLLLVLGKGELGDLVWQSQLLERDGDLDAIGSLGGIEVDIGLFGGHFELLR